MLHSYLKKRRENGLTSSERKDTGHSYVWLFLTFVAALYSHFSLSPLMFIQENRSHTLGRPSLSWTNNRKMCYEVHVYEYEWNAPTYKWQSQTLILWTENLRWLLKGKVQSKNYFVINSCHSMNMAFINYRNTKYIFNETWGTSVPS